MGSFGLAVRSGQVGGESFFDNWWLTGPTLVAAVSVLAALVTGLVALTRRGAVLLSVAIGVLVAVFVLSESWPPRHPGSHAP
jgi:hypothetical protein